MPHAKPSLTIYNLLKISDIISVHVPFDLTTKMMFTEKEFEMMISNLILTKTT